MTRRLMLALTVGALSVLTGCAILRASSRPATDLQIERTPERVARGDYLFNHMMACVGCHTPQDPKTLAVDWEKRATGGRLFSKEMGFPGSIYSPNLTADPETGLGSWTDDEILRAIREGVRKDGSALFPLMPYPAYHDMDDEDAKAIVAYLRTLPAVRSKVPDRQLDFPVNMIVNSMPLPLTKPVKAPANGDAVARGRYVLAMASCTDCHTPRKGPDLDNSKFLGGAVMAEGGKSFKVPNITPDPEQGIGNWTDQQIADAIRLGRRPDGRQLAPVMPWPEYSGINDDDMKALIAYLRSVKPLK